MTISELKQYRSICAEIVELRITIKENLAHETVRGSDSSFPYLAHAMSISGLPGEEKHKETLERVRWLETQKRDIEQFINDIEDSMTRRIFKMRILMGWNWSKVAVNMGGGNTKASVKMMFYRYIKKQKK